MIRKLAQTYLAFVFVGSTLALSAEVEVLLSTIDTDDARLAQQSSLELDSKGAGDGAIISIDRSQVFQLMLGYGAALTDSAAVLLLNLRSDDEARYRAVLERLFSIEKGAGFRVLRLAVGASDYVATEDYWTYCDEPSPDLEGFSIARDQAAVIPVLKDILEIAPDLRLIGTPWSAPAWMKENGSLGGVSEEEKEAGVFARLKRDSFSAYADYFIKFLQSYQAEGIEIYGLTLQNEPQNDLSEYPCMRMDAADQIQLVKFLAPRLETEGFKTQLFVHDHNWTLHANDYRVMGGDVKKDPLESVLEIFADPTVKDAIAGSAWHCYSGDATEMERVYRALNEKLPKKMILTTEATAWGDVRGDWWSDIEWGMAHVWLRPQLEGSAAALQWNLVLDQNWGPSPRDDSRGYGLLTYNTEKKDIAYEREFFAMAQLSRAALPGAQRVGVSASGSGSGGLDTIAFLLPKDRASLVVFNRNGDGRSFRVADGEQGFGYEIPGHSMATFVW
ncbi:MAG: glycoside hydrolase family 30 protein [Roseibacillus sp.]